MSRLVLLLLLTRCALAQSPCTQAVPAGTKAASITDEIRKAAEGGDRRSEYQVALAYRYGCGMPANADSAAQWMRRAAEHGDALAQEVLGVMYHSGEGVTRDASEALKWFRAAAKQGNAAAMFNVAVAYYNGSTTGEAVGESQFVAKVWMTLAKEFGDKQAESSLSHIEANLPDVELAVGKMYLAGTEIPANIDKGVQWSTDAANHGSMKAKILLGAMYSEGKGVPQDDHKALAFFLAAAAQGSDEANYRAAKMYESGRGTSADIREAIKRYELVANNRHEEAMLALANIYEQGSGTGKKDPVKAYRWALLAKIRAVDLKHEELAKQADSELAKVAAELDPKQIAKINKSIHAGGAPALRTR